jgi:AcrR family transcriptional regulator
MVDGLTPAREHAIMEATRAELASDGFVDLTLEQVAVAAQESPTFVAAHYDSTVDLAASFVEYETDRLEEFLFTASEDPAVRLRELLELTVGLAEIEDDEIVPAYMEMYGRADRHEELREALREFEDEMHAALVDTVADGVDQGRFRDCDPESIATMIFAAHEATFNHRALAGDAAFIRDALDDVVLSRIRPADD